MRTAAKLTACAFAALALQGCASQPPLEATNGLSTRHPSTATYAKLEKTTAGYRFTAFSDSYASDAAWVRLHDGQPMWRTAPEFCAAGLADWLDHHFQCKTANGALFRKKRLDTSPTGVTAYLVSSYLTYGVFATLPPARVTFDAAAYRDALREASAELAAAPSVAPNRWPGYLLSHIE